MIYTRTRWYVGFRSIRELQEMSAVELKAHLKERGVPTADCFDKSDLLARAQEST